MENPIKMADLGVFPLFLETPICESLGHLATLLLHDFGQKLCYSQGLQFLIRSHVPGGKQRTKIARKWENQDSRPKESNFYSLTFSQVRPPLECYDSDSFLHYLSKQLQKKKVQQVSAPFQVISHGSHQNWLFCQVHVLRWMARSAPIAKACRKVSDASTEGLDQKNDGSADPPAMIPTLSGPAETATNSEMCPFLSDTKQQNTMSWKFRDNPKSCCI